MNNYLNKADFEIGKGCERMNLDLDVLRTNWSIDLGDSIQSACEITNVYHDNLWHGTLWNQDPAQIAQFFAGMIERTIRKMQEKGYRQLSLTWVCSKSSVDES